MGYDPNSPVSNVERSHRSHWLQGQALGQGLWEALWLTDLPPLRPMGLPIGMEQLWSLSHHAARLRQRL
jgi:hypothetical protein